MPSHGVGGEVLVVRKLSPGTLPSSSLGGPRGTKLMIHVTWHTTTIAFLTVGLALLLSGSVVHGDTARGLSLIGWRERCGLHRGATVCADWREGRPDRAAR